MPYLQLVIDLGAGNPAEAEAACFASGAMAVTFTDAADDPVLEPGPGATPLWPRIRLAALFPADADGPALAARLAGRLGLEPAQILLQTLADRVWEREWLRDFRPMRFGRRLWIRPAGQPVHDPAAVVLDLDPGLAFGTGTHATTALCLEWLDSQELAGSSVLDYGCGSGVLALAALKLGAARALAVDVDPQALVATRDNARRNGLEARLSVRAADALPETCWDVVLANILAGPLLELAPRLARATRAGGRIVLAGMLEEQAETVAVAYRPWFHMRVSASREGWTALTGQKTAE